MKPLLETPFEFSRNTLSLHYWHLIEKYLVDIAIQIHLMENNIFVPKRLKLILDCVHM